jgi:predicted DNA-binding transcriptional regulator YafY
MRRADRLFEIVQRLRGGRLVTARALGDALEVSVRTIYRDVADLQASGVPIDGAAGVGYLLRPGYHLPPLMFRPTEIEALIVGARMVAAWGGRELAAAAGEALVRIAAVVPPERMQRAERVPIFASALRFQDGERANLDRFAKGIDHRLKMRFAYRDADGTASERLVWPLALHFWGQVWTLAAWCELRDDFRTFRIDRAEWVTATEEAYPNLAGRTLQDYLDRVRRCGPEGDRFVEQAGPAVERAVSG